MTLRIDESGTTTTAIAHDASDGTFAGRPYFTCPASIFDRCVQGKKNRKRWQNFLGDDMMSSRIREFIKSNPKNKNILLRREGTGMIINARQ